MPIREVATVNAGSPVHAKPCGAARRRQGHARIEFFLQRGIKIADRGPFLEQALVDFLAHRSEWPALTRVLTERGRVHVAGMVTSQRPSQVLIRLESAMAFSMAASKRANSARS